MFQLHIATEETKFGLSFNELCELLESDDFKTMDRVNLRGLMGMATYTQNTEQIEAEFEGLKNGFDVIKQNYFSQKQD